MKEKWKPITGYESLYEISNLGRVKSLNKIVHREKMGDFFKASFIMIPTNWKGYLSVILSKNGISKKYRVHRLVAEAFIPNPNNLPEVNHKDEDKSNNKVDNLEWCEHLYNMNYGTWTTRREKNFDRSYCYKKVAQYDLENNIIRVWGNIALAQRELNISHISDCCNGKRKSAGGYIWKYIK